MTTFPWVIMATNPVTKEIDMLPPNKFTKNQHEAIEYIIANMGRVPTPPINDVGTTLAVVENIANGAVRQTVQDARRAISRQQGYTGDCCSKCGLFTMKQAGHCLTCDSCGETTGCS